jgi:hypothetical protein
MPEKAERRTLNAFKVIKLTVISHRSMKKTAKRFTYRPAFAG